MGIVYRYTDLSDNTIKYIGIVWSGNRTLEQRVNEHKKNDSWCQDRAWKIEYLKKNITSRTDAEYLEAHYVNKFGTDAYFNIHKSGWGESDIINESSGDEEEWVLYSIDEDPVSEFSFDFYIDKIIYKIANTGDTRICLKNEENLPLYIDNTLFVKIKEDCYNFIPGAHLFATIINKNENTDVIEWGECIDTINHIISHYDVKVTGYYSEIDGSIERVRIEDVLTFNVYNGANGMRLGLDLTDELIDILIAHNIHFCDCLMIDDDFSKEEYEQKLKELQKGNYKIL